MDTHSEPELLCRLSQGDHQALTSIYHQYWQIMFLSAYNLLKDKKACEDIVQEIFLHLWYNKEKLQVKENLKVYLLAATRYQVFYQIKKLAAKQGLSEHLSNKLSANDSDGQLVEKDIKKQVETIVAVLPEKCQIIYRLSREQELSHREISSILNISTKTVENQLTIALKRLRNSLGRVCLVLLFALWM
jgi:RNA polymerase sigma-70 factor (family 1)